MKPIRCLLGFHDWKRQPSPPGIMEGHGAPLLCSRCGRGAGGMRRPGTEYPRSPAMRLHADSATVLRLQPGDVLLFRSEAWLSGAQRKKLTEDIKRLFGDRELLILDGGASLSVLREPT